MRSAGAGRSSPSAVDFIAGIAYGAAASTLRPANTVNQPSTGACLVSDSAELEALCARWGQRDVIALDTEFVRTRTYYARLGLIQVGDGDGIWLLDAVALGDWTALAEVFRDQRVEKVVHAAGEDLQILQHSLGCVPEPLFDTQIAANLAGVGANASYQNLVAELLDIEVDKDQTRSDWLKRPLGTKQLRYAADDVRHLIAARDALAARLQKLDRLSWMREECAALVRNSSADPLVADLYGRFGASWKMDDAARGRLWRLCEWRENTARKRDLPRTWLLKNPAIAALARTPPAGMGGLGRVDGVDGRTIRRHGQEIIDVLAEPPMEPAPDPAPLPLDEPQRTRLKTLRRALTEIAQELDLQPEFILTRRDLEALARGGHLNDVVGGWRAELLNAKFTDL